MYKIETFHIPKAHHTGALFAFNEAAYAMKKKVWVRENSLLAGIAARRMGYDRVALVVGRTIHLHQTPVADFLKNRSWLLHELKHVEQYERLGTFLFLWKYLRESIRNGYHNNALEVEARNAEQDVTLLARYDLSAYTGGA